MAVWLKENLHFRQEFNSLIEPFLLNSGQRPMTDFLVTIPFLCNVSVGYIVEKQTKKS
jgi:hypothetical protein